MPRNRSIRAAVLAAAACVAGAAAEVRAEGGWWDSEPRRVPLERIMADPIGYKNVPVILTIQFYEKRDVINPFFTPFTPDRYNNFSGWADGAELWDREQYKKVYPFFFVDRDDAFSAKLGKTEPRTRITCRAVVRAVFRGEPWIEVTQIREQPESVTPECVQAVLRGHKAFDKGDKEAAIRAYREAIAFKPGNGPEAAIHRHLAWVYWSQQDLRACKEEIATSLRLYPDDPGALDLAEILHGAEMRLLAIDAPQAQGLPSKEGAKPPAEPLNPPAPKPGPPPAPKKAEPPAAPPATTEKPAPKPEEEQPAPPPSKKRPSPPK